MSKAVTLKKGRHIINVDQMAELLQVISWEKLDNLNFDYYWQAAKGADADAETEEEGEEALQVASDAARDELVHKWHSAVVAVFERLLEEHKLRIVPRFTGKTSKFTSEYPFEYVVLPATTWREAANALRETINGVGTFRFNSLREFLDSGPYTARKAALGHLHWLPDWFRVYGGSANGAYQAAMR